MSSREFYEENIAIKMAGKVGARLYRQSIQNREPSPIESLCFHEAAHCVIARHYGREVECIEITESGGITKLVSSSTVTPIRILSDEEFTTIAAQFFADDGGDPAELDLWEVEFSTELLLRKVWRQVELIAGNLISRCAPGETLHVTLSAGAIRRILE